MWRLWYVIVGLASMLLAIGLVWLASPSARLFLTGGGLPMNPKDFTFVFLALFGVGFVLTVGTLVEGALNTVASVLTGGQNVSREYAMAHGADNMRLGSLLSWGVPCYAALSLAFGFFVTTMVQRREFSLGLLTDTTFWTAVSAWPYHVVAAIGPWGLTIDKFY